MAPRPACQKCGTAARVKRDGVAQRKEDRVQMFHCGQCDVRFVHPSARKVPPELSSKIKARIRRMTRAGMSQKQIAHKLGISRGSVYRAQRRSGLSLRRHGPRKPEMELNESQKAEVLALLRSGTVSRRQIVERLKVPHRAVRLIAESYGIHRRKGNVPWRERVAPEILEKVLDEIRNRANYGLAIAAKFDAPRSAIYELAKEELGAMRFRPGAALPAPFTSDNPILDEIYG